MDNVKNEIVLTPENIKDSTIKSSTRRTSISNSREKFLPQYLRASTGSCHDFCKYGRVHTFRDKGDGPTRKGTMGSTADESSNGAQVSDVPIRKKKLIISSNHSSEQKPQVPETPIITKQVIEVVEREAPSSLEKLDSSKDHSAPPKRDKKQLVKPRLSVNPKVKVSDKAKFNETASPTSKEADNSKDEIGINLKPVTVKSPLNDSQGREGGRASVIKKVSSPVKFKIGQRKVASPRVALLSKPSFSRVASIKLKNVRASKAASPSEKQDELIEPTLLDEEKVIEKVLYMIEPKPGDKIFDPAENVSNSRLLSLSSSSVESSPNTLPYPKKEKKITSRLSSGEESKTAVMDKTVVDDKKPSLNCSNIERKKSIETVKPDYNQKFRRPATDKRISQYAKAGKTNQIESVKLESKEKSRRPTTDDSASQRAKSGTKNQIKPPKQELKLRPIRRMETTPPKNKDISLKLNVRKGKTVNVHSDNNSPRRFRFRPGQVQDNHNVKSAIRRTFKPIQVVGRGPPKAKSERVTLRHQNINGKKDTQGLFNIVIEETASKLVELRKSKVKALVGAFETVISLQEGKKTSVTITK